LKEKKRAAGAGKIMKIRLSVTDLILFLKKKSAPQAPKNEN